MRLLFSLLLALALPAAAQLPVSASGKYKREAIGAYRSVLGFDAPSATLAAQVEQESAWRPDAVSRVGARGLTQFMPATAADVHKKYSDELGSLPLYSASWALKAQAFYMRDLLGAVKAYDDCNRWAKGLSAYNGGLGWVRRDEKLAASRGIDPLVWYGGVEEVNSGRSAENKKENKEYPARIQLRLEPRYVAALWGKGTCTK